MQRRTQHNTRYIGVNDNDTPLNIQRADHLDGNNVAQCESSAHTRDHSERLLMTVERVYYASYRFIGKLAAGNDAD